MRPASICCHRNPEKAEVLLAELEVEVLLLLSESDILSSFVLSPNPQSEEQSAMVTLKNALRARGGFQACKAFWIGEIALSKEC